MPKSTQTGSPRGRSRKPLSSTLNAIKLFATDVDGVLTDGGMYHSESGDEFKKFNARDGMGLKLLQAAGLITAFVTMEQTALVARCGAKLAIPEIHQGARDKLVVLRELVAQYGLTLRQVAYMGDDVNDLQALRAVAFSAAPADCVDIVRKSVDYVCRLKGGEGAVREVVDLILAAQGKSVASGDRTRIRNKRHG